MPSRSIGSVMAWSCARKNRRARASLRGTDGNRRDMRGSVESPNPNSDMNALIASVAQFKDKAAFKTLFEYFAPRVKAYLQGQGTAPDMAEEVVQETMVNIWRKASQFDATKASASTWIFTIARNLRIDLIRRASRPAPDMNDPAMVPEPEPTAPELISREQEANRLKRAVAKLPAEQQEVLRLAFFEDKAHAEVATELGLPLGTVKSRIRLAFGRIRTELGESR
ncbi:MAG: sigma-70 family RNA polymerase sigma factor [Rickettsiales bacterium]